MINMVCFIIMAWCQILSDDDREKGQRTQNSDDVAHIMV